MKYSASVIIPARNEAEKIGRVLNKLKMFKKYEIIIVDDGSTDDTANIIRNHGFEPLVLEKNFGKGYACMAGAKKAKADFLVFLDADAQLEPERIPDFASALKDCDVTIGKRSMDEIPRARRLSNRVARKMVKSITGKYFGDVLCGFKAIRKDKFFSLGLAKHRYEFECEMMLAAVRNGLEIKEITVSVDYSRNGSGMNFKDSLKVFLFLLKEWIKK